MPRVQAAFALRIGFRSIARLHFPQEGSFPMSTPASLPNVSNDIARALGSAPGRSTSRIHRTQPAPLPFRSIARAPDDSQHRDAELFYLQKQIHAQTQMVIVLGDGEQIEGCIEWYDRNSLKIRGRVKSLIYKSAIKYMYKVGDTRD
jgi:sRNA-binding regulator protein Hfq